MAGFTVLNLLAMIKFKAFVIICLGLVAFMVALKSDSTVVFWIFYIMAMYLLIVPANEFWLNYFKRGGR
jgi:hypothetical protein